MHPSVRKNRRWRDGVSRMVRSVVTMLALAGLALITASPAPAGDPDPVPLAPAVPAAGSFTIIAYHAIRHDVRDYPDSFAVDASALIRQFAWLHGNGFAPVSVDAIIAARQGGKPLPTKAVLLSFDDGFLSFYTRVYPLLREFRFPAVLSVVGGWIDRPRRGQRQSGDPNAAADIKFVSWGQLREMVGSGLVEIASHSYDIHHGVLGNPQGNRQPAATTRILDPATGSYEGDAAWRSRVAIDLAKNSDVIERQTGQRPRVIAWPYGRYNDELVDMARALGMPIALTLEDGTNTPDVALAALRRTLVEHNPVLIEFASVERGPLYPQPVRVLEISLDQIHSPDAARQERNLSALLNRVDLLEPTLIFLQAITAEGGSATYFPNRHLPLRADLFNRVAWQLVSRTGVSVFAVMPLAVSGLSANQVVELYADLARHATFDGLVFDDTGTSEKPGMPDFTLKLATHARAFRAPLKTVRILSMTLPEVAQDFSAFVADYDYIALRLLPANNTVVVPDHWWTALRAQTGPLADELDPRRKVIFLLDGKAPARQMRALQLGGAVNFGYRPADLLHDDPPLAQFAPAMSLRVDPVPRGNPK